VEHALRSHLPRIKEMVSPGREMGVGLRLSALAARQLDADDGVLSAFKSWLQRQQLYVYTVNGFPYGAFHGQSVKEHVYRPDWAEPARLDYSMQLARVLSAFLPEDQHGSISTVPVGFKPDFVNPDRLRKAITSLLRFAAFASGLERDSGKLIRLALEPEPGCFLETTRDAVVFFQQHVFSKGAVEQLQQHMPGEQLEHEAGIALLKRHLGVCLDTCHAAVMFERPLEMLQTLAAAGIPVHKIQLTAALHIPRLTPALRQRLSHFADEVYLHQTSVRTAGGSDAAEFYLDLAPALDKSADGAELRSHFHVPVFAETLGGLRTTQPELIELLTAFKAAPSCPHLEVETYTFDVLPTELRQDSVDIHIAREINWVRERLET
jgi:hypothetical protein